MKITDDIIYIGVNDRETDLFESQFPIPGGMAYNSYVIRDEKIAVMDTMERHFGGEWFAKLETTLGGRQPDYLIVQHMEPDHSANIVSFAEKYPGAVIVSSAQAFRMMKNFFGTDYADRRLVVGEGAKLELGRHMLSFLTAPMVHWPEVIMTYDAADKALFSADAFGRFGTPDDGAPWEDEARRYYIGIVGKYGVQVQAVLKKCAALDIAVICPLHGPALTGDIDRYVSLYDTWSSYKPEEEGVLIAYTSVYGHTREAAETLRGMLAAKGCNVLLYDLARSDLSEAVAQAFRMSKLVLASTTYNAGLFPRMETFIEALCERGFQKRTVALIENGSWAPMAGKVMKGMLEGCKDIAWTETTVRIVSALNEASLAQIEALVEELS